MPTLIIISILSFNTNFGCIQHLDNKSSTPPEGSKVIRQRMDTTLIELHGGHAVLQCDKAGIYTAYTLEEV